MGLRSVIFKEEMSRYMFNMSAGVFRRIVLIALFAGVAVWLLGFALDKYALTPMFCDNNAQVSTCLHSTVISSNIAAVMVSIMVVPLLTMVHMKRSLLVVLAAVIALWGVAAWTAGAWWLSLLWTALAYVTVYAAISWINRLRGDVAAIVFIGLFVTLARVVLSL